jgi:hypothetical protein
MAINGLYWQVQKLLDRSQKRLAFHIYVSEKFYVSMKCPCDGSLVIQISWFLFCSFTNFAKRETKIVHRAKIIFSDTRKHRYYK